MKFSKKLLVPLLLVTTILILMLWVLSRSINPETIKESVVHNLNALTSQPTRIEGQVNWQILPQPGIRINHIEIGDPANKDNYSLKLDNLVINLKVMPLLRGKFVFSDIKVDGFIFKMNADSPALVLTEKNKQENFQNKQADCQVAIEQLLLSHGQLILVQNEQVTKFTDVQIGAEKINLQRDSFLFQFKSNIEYMNSHIPIAGAQIQFKGSTNLTGALINKTSLKPISLRANGQLIIQKAWFANFKINKISANTTFKNNVLHLNPFTINLYQGESVGNLSYELSKKILDINLTANNLNSAKLTYDLFHKKLLKGKADLSLHTRTDFQKPSWQESSTANGNLSMRDGSIETVNMSKVIDITSTKIDNLLSGKDVNSNAMLELTSFDNPEFFKGTTPFSLMTLKYKLNNAQLISDAIYLQAKGFQVKGESKVNLNNFQLESHFLTMVEVTQQKVADIQRLLGGSFPIIVNGTITQPVVLPDLKKVNPVLARFVIQNTLTKPVKQIKNQLSSLLTR